jgi:integrase
MNYEKLKEVALTRFNSFRKFSIADGFSDVGLKETFMNRTMKVADLEKISKLPTLSKILGHSTVKQTMDTYVGITELMLDEGMANFNKFNIT